MFRDILWIFFCGYLAFDEGDFAGTFRGTYRGMYGYVKNASSYERPSDNIHKEVL